MFHEPVKLNKCISPHSRFFKRLLHSAANVSNQLCNTTNQFCFCIKYISSVNSMDILYIFKTRLYSLRTFFSHKGSPFKHRNEICQTQTMVFYISFWSAIQILTGKNKKNKNSGGVGGILWLKSCNCPSLLKLPPPPPPKKKSKPTHTNNQTDKTFLSPR